jgi:lipoyl-dependent peroxiredoxin subunit D
MSALEALRASLPEEAKDVKLNLQTVLQGGSLADAQRWGVAIAAAVSTRDRRLVDALVEGASAAGVPAATISDAKAAAVVMGMNNVFYRFRHLIGTESYAERPPRLRMNRLAQPAGNKVDFELFALGVSAINACETCVRAHEHVVLEGGMTEEHVHDAVRIASTVQAAAVALSFA